MALRDTDEYDMVADVWTAKTDKTTTASYGVGAAPANYGAYYVGGYSGSSYLADCDAFYHAMNAWIAGTAPGFSMADNSLTAMGKKLYVMGGSTTGPVTSARCDEYDPSAATWASKTAATLARNGRGGKSGYNTQKFATGTSGSSKFDAIANSWAAMAAVGYTGGTDVDEMGSASV